MARCNERSNAHVGFHTLSECSVSAIGGMCKWRRCSAVDVQHAFTLFGRLNTLRMRYCALIHVAPGSKRFNYVILTHVTRVFVCREAAAGYAGVRAHMHCVLGFGWVANWTRVC